MIHRSLREWSALAIAENGDSSTIPRWAADSLVATAAAATLGGAEGERILTANHRHLRAQQVVGVVAAPRATLEILPKIDGFDTGDTRRRLIHMLARVFDIDISTGSLADLEWQDRDVLEILIRLFCNQLFEAVRRGLPRQYVREEADLNALRGRLNTQRQFTVLAAAPQKLACRYDDLSPDIPLNQIMAAAIAHLATLARAPENQRRLTELSFAYADVSRIPVAGLPWGRVVRDRSNASWGALLNLARLFLGRRFQTTSAGDGRGYALLFEMNTLFEEYIGRMFQNALAGTGLTVRLQGPQDFALTADDGARRFATKPDIVISQAGKPVLIVDTKWKRLKDLSEDAKHGVGQADVYQMMAYARVYACADVMLLYPHHNGIGAGAGIIRSHQITGGDDTRLLVASMSLSDLDSIPEKARDLVAKVVRTC